VTLQNCAKSCRADSAEPACLNSSTLYSHSSVVSGLGYLDRRITRDRNATRELSGDANPEQRYLARQQKPSRSGGGFGNGDGAVKPCSDPWGPGGTVASISPGPTRRIRPPFRRVTPAVATLARRRAAACRARLPARRANRRCAACAAGPARTPRCPPAWPVWSASGVNCRRLLAQSDGAESEWCMDDE
jgi:hypothetical protein